MCLCSFVNMYIYVCVCLQCLYICFQKGNITGTFRTQFCVLLRRSRDELLLRSSTNSRRVVLAEGCDGGRVLVLIEQKVKGKKRRERELLRWHLHRLLEVFVYLLHPSLCRSLFRLRVCQAIRILRQRKKSRDCKK